jgi:hypothetical protein
MLEGMGSSEDALVRAFRFITGVRSLASCTAGLLEEFSGSLRSATSLALLFRAVAGARGGEACFA